MRASGVRDFEFLRLRRVERGAGAAESVVSSRYRRRWPVVPNALRTARLRHYAVQRKESMHTFALKPKTAAAQSPGRSRSGQGGPANLIHQLQRTAGNQAVQRLLSDNAASSSGRVHFQSEPTKQPPTPEPQKDEKPLGKLKDQQSGAEEK